MSPPLQPSDLGLILSYKCQSACAHCLYNCSPDWQDWMSPGDIDAALHAMLAWAHPAANLFQVHITGGEPFLNFPLLLYAVEAAARLHINRYVETNAGWCVRESLVAERFRLLKDAGLQAILISCSPFHAETISPEKTLLAVRLAMEIFGPQRVMVYLPEWIERISWFGMDSPAPLELYEEAFGQLEAGRMLWDDYGLIAGGRSGYRLGHLRRKLPAISYQGQSCCQEIFYAVHSHFDLYGNYIPGFCGGLTLGSWRSLPALIKATRLGQLLPLISILAASGPYGLYEYARRQHGYEPQAGGYAGKCHLCVDVRRHLAWAASGCYLDLAPLQFYKQLDVEVAA